MYDAVICGFDNVLIGKDEAINLSTVLEIDRLRHSGKKFIIYTNRSYKDIMYYNSDFTFIDYIISSNGSFIYDVINKNIIYEKILSNNIIKSIRKSINNKIFIFNNLERIELTDNCRNINKLDIACSSKKEVNDVIDKINNLNLKVNISYYKYRNKYWVEVINNTVSMESSIKKLSKYLNIKINKFGIITNDDYFINMKNVGFLVATEDANKKLRDVSNFVTSSNNNKGVEVAIKKFFK